MKNASTTIEVAGGGRAHDRPKSWWWTLEGCLVVFVAVLAVRAAVTVLAIC